MSNWMDLLTLIAALGAGLIAGTFFAFSAFVMKSLARLPAAQGIAAMQAINIVVLNPVFLGVFLGTGVICIVLALAALLAWGQGGTLLLLAGSLLYLVGTVLVTIRCNVPRNSALAAVSAADTGAASLWETYLREWTAWNHVRALAALLALALFIMALAAG